MTNKAEIANLVKEFVAVPVPGYGSPDLDLWKKSARDLGAPAIEYFIDELRNGPESGHYAAVLALRELGVRAYGHGYYQNIYYTVKKNGDEFDVVIYPRYKISDPGI
jgi:hypothetical protein